MLLYFLKLELRFLLPWLFCRAYFELPIPDPLIMLSPTMFEELLFWVLLYLLWPKCSPEILIELWDDPLNWVAVVTLPKVRDELPLNPLIYFFPTLLFAKIFLGVTSLLVIWFDRDDEDGIKILLPAPAPNVILLFFL